jgi:hypothetical protein
MLVRYPAMRLLLIAGSASLLALMGCSGGGSGMSAGSMPTSPATMTLTADFDSIQANIFTPFCAGCHGGANPAANLNLDATHSYNDLVNVPSTEEPTLDRVKPGDPTNSYLVIHLQKDGGDGAPTSDIPFVVQWIMEGALPGNSAMATNVEFRVGAVEPNFGDALHSSPLRITIGFTQELDTAGVFPGAVRLERIDANADAPNATITVPTSASIPAHNARALILTPAAALRPGQYQVVLSMDSVVAVRSLSGASLSDSTPNDQRERIATRFSVAE